MNKLLNASFYRLKKSKCFWFLLILMFIMGIYFYINYNGFHPERCVNCSNELGSVLFHFIESSWFILPIFTTVFMLPLYNEGIIRNMVIIGHKRKDIYMANLITIIIVNLLFSSCFIIGTLIIGFILVPEITIPLNKLFFLIGNSIILSISYASLFNFIGMSFDKISSISITFITVMWGMMVSYNLITKFKLNIYYEIILNFLPIGQGLLISNLEGNYKWLWLYSLIFIIIINYLGIVIIKEKKLN